MSKHKTKPLTILIVDDDTKYVESLHRDAQKSQILFKHAENLDSGKEILKSKEGKSLSGIILDVVCMKSKEQEIADNSFITAAIKYFEEKAPHLPIVVLTGEPNQYKNLKELYKGTLSVYSKGRDENEMITFIKQEAVKLERNKVTKEYPEVFEVVDKHMGFDATDELLKCLKDMKSSDLPIIKGALTNIRSLLEKLFFTLHDIDKDLIPKEYVFNEKTKRSEINFSSIKFHLNGRYDNSSKKHTGKIYIPIESTISRQLELVYRACSEGIHAIKDDSPTKPTKYTVQCITFALLDLLLWMKKATEK